MHVKIVLSLLLVLISPKVAKAGEKTIVANKPWPVIKEAVVNAHVYMSTTNFMFEYDLINLNINAVDFCVFSVDIRNNPLEHPFSVNDTGKKHSKYAHALLIAQAESIVPLSIVNPAKKFTAPMLRPAWGAISPSPDFWVPPGESLNGFGMLAEEPPGIREYHVRALTQDFYNYPERFLNPTAQTHAELIEEANKGINYYSRTVAPVKPPSPFTISAWISRMSTDAAVARKLKWIKTDKSLNVVQKLIAGLNTVDKSKLRIAIKKIEEYVLEEKTKGNLTDEADALVRLNAQYLLRRLENPEAVK